MATALGEMRVFWSEQLDNRRREGHREGDLFSYLLDARFDDEPLDDEVLLDMCTVLTLAGLDTTRAELAYMFHHLAQHPEHRRRLVEDPEIIPLAVEETLRYYTIIFGDGRKVTRDVEFHGVQLKKGDMVYGLVSGANRDPRGIGSRPTSSSSTARRTTTSGSRAARTAASECTWRAARWRSPLTSGSR